MILYSPDNFETKDPFGIFEEVVHITHKNQLKTDGVLILWGGEDIGTKLYNEEPNKWVSNEYPSKRDLFEIELITEAISKGIPIIGICRGAQLLCVSAGGKLMQHINNHNGTHKVTLHDEGGSVIACNSAHHQMMIPNKSAKILASATETTGNDQYNTYSVIDEVPEVVYFPLIKALGIQAHPEWNNCPRDFVAYCTRKIKEYLL
jgi:gamma-glutamyl-gamma-aminobutyrate hydrolase PuuD